MKPITVVGAGFSGLVTAYFLTKAGHEVSIVEKSSRAGGLINSIRTEHGLVETAANGLLNSVRLETMAQDIGVPLLATRREARKRFIYRGKPRQIPVNPLEAVRAAVGLAANSIRLRPRPFETITDWGSRVLGKGATEYLLVPALGGIYAGDPKQLSASLIFGSAKLPEHLGTYRPEKAKVRGTVAPPDGMLQLIDGLTDYLRHHNVQIRFETDLRPQTDQSIVVCLSARGASAWFSDVAPNLSEQLAKIEMLSILTTTSFYPENSATVKGFGCLFPRDQGFRARGVLFNDWIFEGRGPAHAETWIFGGALDSDIVQLGDEDIRRKIESDRERFYQRHDEPLRVHITRWPNALPHYSIEMERLLAELPAPPTNTALVGNYLGRIGLAKILERAAYVVEKLVPTWN